LGGPGDEACEPNTKLFAGNCAYLRVWQKFRLVRVAGGFQRLNTDKYAYSGRIFLRYTFTEGRVAQIKNEQKHRIFLADNFKNRALQAVRTLLRLTEPRSGDSGNTSQGYGLSDG